VKAYIVLLWLGLSFQAQAALTIDINGGETSKIPVAISPFGGAGDVYRVITDVVGTDLVSSGELSLVDVSDLNPPIVEPTAPRFRVARARGAEAIVLGHVDPQPNGQVDVRFRLMDAVQQTQLAGYSYTADSNQLRTIAHKIADVVYQKLIGVPGNFSSHIMYVMKSGKTFRLEVADSDGYDAQTVLKSVEPIMSPAWSRDGSKIAYVSFESGHAVVYEQSMSTGKRFVLARFQGSNSAPAWSPEGSRLALVLTRDKGSQLYVMNADGSGLTRLTFGGRIDTEPNWSPDGRTLLFTSDRDGSPQIYQMPASGGAATRMTFEGNYSVSPRWSPDGKSFVFVQRQHGQFHIALMDVASGQVQILTNGDDDESPSFAPNGKMILYATVVNHRGELAVVSVDGKTHERLFNPEGGLESPVWGP
jgi:TolB protein